MTAKNLTSKQSRGDLGIHNIVEFVNGNVQKGRRRVDAGAID